MREVDQKGRALVHGNNGHEFFESEDLVAQQNRHGDWAVYRKENLSVVEVFKAKEDAVSFLVGK
jgi:hypothetical protein